MRTDKELAIRLRLNGKSYTEIQKEIGGISKGTLSAWLKGVVMNDAHRARLLLRTREKSLRGLLKHNKMQTVDARRRKDKVLSAATREIKGLSRDQLFILGVALYWAEGHKRPLVRDGREISWHPISLTNSDPYLVRIFIKFLKEIGGIPIERVKANLRIFQHLNGEEMLRFWVKETGIPPENFSKTYLGISKSSMGKRPFNRLPYGVIQIRISDTNLFHKIMGWIAGVKQFA